MKKILMLLLVASCFLFAREYQRSDFASSSSLEGVEIIEESQYVEPKEDSAEKTQEEVVEEDSAEKTQEKEESK
jgi:hypothetical protein